MTTTDTTTEAQETAIDTLPDLSLEQITVALARQGFVAILWHIDDVKTERPELTDAQCMEVLDECARRHDPCFGVVYETLCCHAEELFPDTDEASEEDGAEGES